LREQLHREGAWIEATKEQFENTVTATNGAAMQEIDAYLEQHAAMYRKALEKAMPKDVLVTVFPSSR
jgi:phage-related protein